MAGPLAGDVTVAVSIHNATSATRACIESLLRHDEGARRILLLDDASTDPQMAVMLASFAGARPGLELQPSARNLGYTATVNRGCELAGRDDVVLLNSDTEVSRGWLEKLRRAAASRPRVATVTPVSNAAGVFSVPDRGRVNRLPVGLSLAEMARLVEEESGRLYPEVPTGNGYCLYVRRQVLDEIGLFDAATFPQGCGEENDFCMRALRAGFVHLVDDATYIFHRRSSSLGWRKRWLTWRAQRRLARLYPEYESLVAAWLGRDPLDPFRCRLRRVLEERVERNADRKPV